MANIVAVSGRGAVSLRAAAGFRNRGRFDSRRIPANSKERSIMRRNLVLLVGAVALIGSATRARAGAYGETEQVEESPRAASAAAMHYEEENDYARVGPYLGVGGNYAIQNFDNHGPGNVGNSSGFHVRAGYRVHPNVAIEALYDHFLKFDNDGQARRLGNTHTTDHYDGWQATLNVKGYILTGRWQPYVLAGVGYIDINGHNVVDRSGPGNDLVTRFGLGMDACITEHIAMGPEVAYVLPFGDANNMDLITVALGLRYKF